MKLIRFRGKNPILYLIAFLFWYGLELLIWKVFAIEKFIDDFPNRKRVEKVIHIMTAVIAVFLAAFFLAVIRHLIGVD